jgi:hypothetical protein
VLNINRRVLKLNNGAAINGGMVKRLREVLQIAEERRVLSEDAPVNARLRVFCLQDDASVFVPYI